MTENKEKLYELIIECIVRRLSTEESLAYLKENGCETSERTYRRYKSSWKTKIKERIIQEREDTHYAEPLQRFETMKQIEKELWSISQGEKNNSVRLRVLNAIVNVQEKISKFHKNMTYTANKAEQVIEESKQNKLKSIAEAN